MPSTPDITEKRPPEPTTKTRVDGVVASRAFDIVALSDVDALVKLIAFGIDIGRPYKNRQDQVPDQFCRVDSMEFREVKSPYNGGTGLFDCVVHYRRPGSSGEGEPELGGPIKWRVERPIITKSVDIDVNGIRIQNTVEEDLDPPATRKKRGSVLVGRWFSQGTNQLERVALFRKFDMKVNSGVFFEAPRGSFLCYGVDVADPENGWMLHTVRFAYEPPKKLPGIQSFYTPVNDAAVGWKEINPPIEGHAEVRLLKGTRERIGSFTDPVSERYKAIPSAENEPVLIDFHGKPVADERARAMVYYHYDHETLDEIIENA